MELQVLISTMNQDNLDFLKNFNLQSGAVVVNQNKKEDNTHDFELDSHQVKIVNSLETGLSRSRNLAIQHATADICLLADDDVTYRDHYKNTIIQAHQDYPEADIIAFQVTRVNSVVRNKTFRSQKSWDGYLSSMKISSVEISFKRQSVVENNISFNTSFGAGEYYSHGEENIFLYDCLNKGLKILYLPIEIGEVDSSESTWFKGFNKQYFHTVGAKFYNMSSKYYHALIMQFAIRKYSQYKHKYSLKSAINLMYDGANQYKNHNQGENR